MSSEPKFSERLSEIDKIINKLQTTDDIDDALQLFQQGKQHVEECNRKIIEAQGKFEEINSRSEAQST
tara:strand:- start:55 stop:258 length:204 start_codon:yes stop_codon:yes gene_type:complete